MTTKVVPGQLVAAPDPAEIAREAATRIAQSLRNGIRQRGRGALALSGGSTPREAYALLAQQAAVPWSSVEVFWVDERAVPPTDERSNYRMVKASLLDQAGVPAACVHRMRAEAPDREAAVGDYEDLIVDRVAADADKVPAFDVMVLGIGEDGHTASLFPGEPTVDIADRFVASVPARGAREARMTLTPPLIEHARSVIVVAIGSGKRDALERAWAAQGDVHRTPARILRGCRGAVTWIIDRAAGGVTA